MYAITKLNSGKWLVQCQIQDGTERWEEDTLDKAVCSLITAARTLNHDYIRIDDIRLHEEQPRPVTRTQDGQILSEDEEKLLADIRRGDKKVLETDHFLLRYRITQAEADLLLAIREGKAQVVRTRQS